MKKHFNKNLIISEEEKQFQLSDACQICKKFIAYDGEKVRDHFHVTDKVRGPAHWSCNINHQLIKKFPYEYMNSFRIFNEEKLPDNKCFCTSLKNGTTVDDSKSLDGHISDEEYWTSKKLWMYLT